MADGDIVHNKLKRIYQKSYKDLCEGKASNSECVRSVVNALRQDLQKKGDLPIKLVQNMVEKLRQTLVESDGNIFVDWPKLNREFEQIVQKVDGRPDLKELTLRAGKNFLHKYRYGLVAGIENASATIMQQYMNQDSRNVFR
jgi:hypothetical protein